MRGYDMTLFDVVRQGTAESFFHEARLWRRKCPNCSAYLRLVLLADGDRLEVCVRRGCGWERKEHE